MKNKKFKLRLSPSMQILLGFMALILLGTFLLALPISNTSGEWLGFVDSLFTSTSAVCVTGLVVVDIAVTFTLFGQIILLILVQIGGLGIVALTSLIFLLLGKKISFSNRLALKESLNRDTIQGVVGFIKKVIIITLIIEGVGALLLLYSTITVTGSFWKGLFSAIFMSVSSFCLAGFDLFGSQALPFLGFTQFATDVLMLLPVMMLIVLGGVGFAILAGGSRNKKTSQHIRVVLIMTAILVFGGAIIFLIAEWNNPLTIGNMNIWHKIVNALFQSVSSRTAGFATFDQGNMTTMGQITTMVLMFIGGSPTSIAGGIKTTTLFVLILFLFKKSNSNGDIVYKDRKITSSMIYKALKIFLYFFLVVLIASIAIKAIEGDNFSLISIMFECISAITTTGFSMGITQLLSVASKIIVAIVMFVGRVGMLTVVLALSSKSDTSIEQVEYTNTDIIIG